MDDDLRDYFQEGQLARDKTGGVTISIIEERRKVKRKEKIVDEQY